jgi:hypothetical protein
MSLSSFFPPIVSSFVIFPYIFCLSLFLSCSLSRSSVISLLPSLFVSPFHSFFPCFVATFLFPYFHHGQQDYLFSTSIIRHFCRKNTLNFQSREGSNLRPQTARCPKLFASKPLVHQDRSFILYSLHFLFEFSIIDFISSILTQ